MLSLRKYILQMLFMFVYVYYVYHFVITQWSDMTLAVAEALNPNTPNQTQWS